MLTPITLASTLEPFRLRLASTSRSSVQVVAPAVVTFLDDSSTVAYQPGNPASLVAKSIYDGATTINATTDKWLLLAVKGTAWPVWIKERDLGTIETLLAGKAWAPLRMLSEGRLNPLFLESSATSFPAGIKGDIIYFDGTAWVVRHIGDPTDVLYVDPVSGTPIWIPLTTLAALLPSSNNPVPTTLQPTGPISLTSSTAAKVLNLGFSAPPANWFQPAPTFDDSSWPNASLDLTSRRAWINGATWVTAAQGVQPQGASFLLRQHFTLLSGAYAASQLFVVEDNYSTLYLNGQLVYHYQREGTDGTPQHLVPISASMLNGSGDNVMAVQIQNSLLPAPGPYAVQYAMGTQP